MLENQNYIIIDIIGSLQDEKRSTNKIDGYYQPENGFLIRDFAINFFSLPPKNVKILAYGCKKNYDIYIHTNNKCYYQIDLNNFFQIDVSSPKIVFDYFTNFDDALNKIDKEISDNTNKKIIIFLDDHGFKGYFSRIIYFRLYEIIMKYPHNHFLILNDSCFSGSFIDLIHAYNHMYELKQSNKKDDINLQLLFSFKNIFKCDSANLNSMRPIDKVTQLIDFFQNIEIPNEDAFNIIMKFNIPKNIDPNEPIEKIVNDTKDQIIQKLFHKVQDILDFKMIVSFYEKQKSQNKDESTQNPEPLFANYQNIFNKNNLKLFLKLSNKDLKGFIQKLDVLYIARNEINFRLTPHKNIEVITSTDNEHVCLSFASIRVNDVIKVYPGSPAMGSFIKEIFMKKDKGPICFSNIEKEITEINGNALYFPMRVKQEFKNRRKKFWTHLYPEHCKETNFDFSFSYTNETLEKIAALRAISSINIKKLTEAANLLTKENSTFNPRPVNDPCADIVAIIALLSKYKKDPITIVNECITTNKVIWDHNPQGIESVSLMIKLSFQLSKNPLEMIATTINILEEACKKAIYDKLVLINNNKQSEDIPNFLFTKEEISKLLKYLNKIQKNCSTDENKISKFYSSLDKEILIKSIFDIEQAIISLLGLSPIFFSVFIASYYLNEMNFHVFAKLASEYLSSTPDKSFLHFLNKDFIKAKNNETDDNFNERKKKNKEIAEYYLLTHINKSLMCVNSYCDAQVKSDAMKIVANQFEVIDTLSIIYILVDVFNGNDDNELFIKEIIDQIETSISKNKISNFFIPTIVSFLPKKTVFYNLYSSLSHLQNGWYEELLKKLEKIQNTEEYKSLYDDILMITRKSLIDQIKINNKTMYLEEIQKMKVYTTIKIQNSIDKVQKLLDISVHKSRNNISKRMNLNIIKDQINEYFNNLPFNLGKNKFFKYLTSSIFELGHAKNNYIDLLISSNIQKEKFIFNEELISDTKNIFERASNELRTVAYLFDISDSPLPELDEFNDKQAIQFPVSAMSARVFNIVEMAPIVDKINGNYDRFDPSDGENPSIRELMGLQSGIMHILTPKDEERKRYKTEPMNNQDIEINVFETDETDSYYSSDYFDKTDSVSFRSIEFDEDNEVILIKKPISLFKHPSIEKYQKLQMSKIKITFIREELELGQCDWEGDVWKSFIYCFNLKLEKIGIQFDPKDDYKEITYPYCIIDGIDIALKFFPLTNVLVFWHNRAQIERFVGKNRICANEIIKAFIQSFDDVDRIVTPLYTSNETYQIRTPDLFKLIYDS